MTEHNGSEKLAAIAAVLALMAMTGSALASSFDGRWAFDPADCARASPGERVPVEIEGERIDYYESSCTIVSERLIGELDQLFEVELACTGEGETWTRHMLFGLQRDTAGQPQYLVEIDTDNGFVLVRHFCS